MLDFVVLAVLFDDLDLVDVLVTGDDDGCCRVSLGLDGASQAGFQHGPAGRDHRGGAEQGEEGAHETGFA